MKSLIIFVSVVRAPFLELAFTFVRPNGYNVYRGMYTLYTESTCRSCSLSGSPDSPGSNQQFAFKSLDDLFAWKILVTYDPQPKRLL